MADKRYAQKVKGKYERFVVHFKPEEYEQINEAISSSGMSKADFIRWAVGQLGKK